MSLLAHELRDAGRRLARRPVASAIAVLSLAIGLAAVLLVAAGLRTALFNRLPGVAHAERLVDIGRADEPGEFDTFSYPDLVDVQTRVRALDAAWGYRIASVYLAGDAGPVTVRAQFASGSYLPALGVQPALGRLLGPADELPGADHAVAVLSAGAHARLFGGDPAVIGRVVRLNSVPTRVVGVTAAGFRGHLAFFGIDVHLPLAAGEAMRLGGVDRENRRSMWLHVGGRLAPGATLEAARAELSALAQALAADAPEALRQRDFVAEPYGPLPAPARRVLLLAASVLAGLGALLLAQASANVATLLYAQTEARSQELAVRSALGASPGRLALGALLDTSAIMLLAGAVASALAWWGRDVLDTLGLPLPPGVDLAFNVDAPVLLIAPALACLLTGLAGLMPAWRLARRAPGAGLVAAQVVGGTGGRRRNWLVAVQTAITLLMLASAALMLRSLASAGAVDSGFRTDAVFVADADMTPLGLAADDAGARMDELLRRLETAPGVDHAGYASVVPLSMSRMGYGEARALDDPARRVSPDVNTVGPGFFATFGLAVRGRAIGPDDTAATGRVAVINETLARALAPDGDALGRVFELGEGEDWERVQVVGVVPDGRYSDLTDAGRAFAFLAARQWPRQRYNLMVSGTLPLAELQRLVTEAARTVLPDLPAPRLEPFERYAALSLLPQRVIGGVATALGGVALLLACLGLYTTLSHQVERRTREFGLRAALGATTRDILTAALGSLLPWLAGGLLIGAAAALGARQVLQGLVLGDAGLGLEGLAAALLLVGFAIVLALQRPLRRAIAVRPMEALRQE